MTTAADKIAQAAAKAMAAWDNSRKGSMSGELIDSMLGMHAALASYEAEKAAAQPPGVGAALAPEYAEAVAEMAQHYGMSEMQVLRAAIRLYQAERHESITITHNDRGPLLSPELSVVCGRGCHCLTQCGDTYDHAGISKPPKVEAAPARTKLEPLFWYRPCGDGLYEGPVHHKSVGGQMLRDEKPGEWVALYATPQPAEQREPLSHDQVMQLFIDLQTDGAKTDSPSEYFAMIVRAIELAHGIGTQQAEGER